MLFDPRTRNGGAARRLAPAFMLAFVLAFIVFPWFGGDRTRKILVGSPSSSLRVAVYEPTPYHGAYRPNWEFGDILADIHPQAPLNPELLGKAIQNNEYDVVFINSCDPKFQNRGHGVLDALNNSTVHEGDFFGIQKMDPEIYAPWAESDRLDVLTLGSHTGQEVRRTIGRWAEETRSTAWERVPVLDWAPVFDPPLSRVPRKVVTGRFDKAAIIGRIQQSSRDYEGVMRELEQAILADPPAWGYKVEGIPQRIIPIEDSPFTLHFIGLNEHKVEFPPLLVAEENPVVVVHPKVTNVEYYSLIRSMDIVLPAFNTDAYYKVRSSASIPAAIMCETPLLASRRLLESYTYLHSPSYIANPLSTTTVRAIEQLRAGQQPWQAAYGAAPAPTVPAAKAFLSPSRWWNTGDTFARYKAALRARNVEIFEGMLHRATTSK
ncbi:uncharacterized protein LOC62_02G002234 [Vanrija pseudolonga]|uniref:Uncharacterized protein n=1 Tax=Vanrija pseudolonga TaxID=143232 RepID=A0AAF0Y220_9TREE|nr:hypothetical protein LOC62_02G002234 [Vanrija pseudolonga]